MYAFRSYKVCKQRNDRHDLRRYSNYAANANANAHADAHVDDDNAHANAHADARATDGGADASANARSGCTVFQLHDLCAVHRSRAAHFEGVSLL